MSLRPEGSIDLRMVELLVCPLTKGRLVWDQARAELISPVARLAYPIRDGIPVMLPSEARNIEDDEIGAKTLPEA